MTPAATNNAGTSPNTSRGGMGDIGPVGADGSWTFVKAFDAGGTRDLEATVVASCVDVTFTGVDIADYRAHKIAVNP